ncbi:heme peroxidase [Periconia macrospinosa]|uniref:Heme peroxidase n=1 Tax=Periconia macrospinosa TaxID=97972 RepID=A0A2V1E0U7_9PLEO|nr:heme peroxidase [Periconia macrospinosa]
MSQLDPKRIYSNSELQKGVSDAKASDVLVDDRNYLTERLIQITSSLPKDSTIAEASTGFMVKSLYDKLEHPPLSTLGDPYKYRTPDGSNNNVLFPNLGKAGSFYCRTVRPVHVPKSLPDPGLLFDALLARESPPPPHPNKISSLFFALATVIIHDIFRTSHDDTDVARTSSYLDLSPLYGSNQEAQDSVRTFKDGKLKPDTFADPRLLTQPPECGALLVCFNRFHNYVVEQLAIINENGRFGSPVSDSNARSKAATKRDNDLFQTARLITDSLYTEIIVRDYVRTILNLHRTHSDWTLDPRRDYAGSPVEKGKGNQVSVEFNLVYWWHSVVSPKNERWGDEMFAKIFPDTSPKDITPEEFLTGMRNWATKIPTDPGERTFGGLQRNPQGCFDDEALIKLVTAATEDCAASFGAGHVPIALKVVETMAVQRARRWGVATLNEVRHHFGLTPHKTFTDINPDPNVAASLKALYGDVDNVEFYPGVVVEEAKQSMTPGSGLCGPFTTTSAILSDAVTLVRSDRFHTLDFSPALLTNFGFNEVSTDSSVAGGVIMYRLLMRAFLPSEMRKIKESLNESSDWSYDAPKFVPDPTVVATWKGVESVLTSPQSYRVSYNKLPDFSGGFEHILSAKNSADRANIWRALNLSDRAIPAFSRSIKIATDDSIRQTNDKLSNICGVDAASDIAALSWTRFTARLFGIRTKSEPSDSRKLYKSFCSIYEFTFHGTDSVNSFLAQRKAAQAYKDLSDIIKPVCESVKIQPPSKLLQNIGINMFNDSLLPDHGISLLRRLLNNGRNVDDVVGIVILLASSIAVLGAQTMVYMLDLFLQEPYRTTHWPEIQKLAIDTSPTVSPKFRQYVQEAIRLTCPVMSNLRVATQDTELDDGLTKRSIKKGDSVILDIAKASREPSVFPNPSEIKLDRPADQLHLLFGFGSPTNEEKQMIVAGLTEQLRIFAGLKGLRRAPGPVGQLGGYEGWASY